MYVSLNSFSLCVLPSYNELAVGFGVTLGQVKSILQPQSICMSVCIIYICLFISLSHSPYLSFSFSLAPSLFLSIYTIFLPLSFACFLSISPTIGVCQPVFLFLKQSNAFRAFPLYHQKLLHGKSCTSNTHTHTHFCIRNHFYESHLLFF